MTKEEYDQFIDNFHKWCIEDEDRKAIEAIDAVLKAKEKEDVCP